MMRWLLAMVLLVLALWLPPLERLQPVHRYLMVFDISQSMDAEDVLLDARSASRLSLARAAVARVINDLPCGSRVGFSAFVGQRTVLLLTPVEICAHYAGLLASLEAIDGRMRYDNASSVGKGLHQSLRAADAAGDGVDVVLLTDGHEAPPLLPGQSGLPRSEALGIGGVIAGVGGDTPVRIPKSDLQGRKLGYWQADEVWQRTAAAGAASHEELTTLHESHLRELAQLSELSYVRVTEPATLTTHLVDNPLADRQVRVAVDYRWVPALLALVVLSSGFLPGRHQRHSPVRSS